MLGTEVSCLDLSCTPSSIKDRRTPKSPYDSLKCQSMQQKIHISIDNTDIFRHRLLIISILHEYFLSTVEYVSSLAQLAVTEGYGTYQGERRMANGSSRSFLHWIAVISAVIVFNTPKKRARRHNFGPRSRLSTVYII